jgi:hypothetical protein
MELGNISRAVSRNEDSGEQRMSGVAVQMCEGAARLMPAHTRAAAATGRGLRELPAVRARVCVRAWTAAPISPFPNGARIIHFNRPAPARSRVAAAGW